VYFNNDRHGYAVKNALRFRRIVRELPAAAQTSGGGRNRSARRKRSPRAR
jgi:hypothetical protein